MQPDSDPDQLRVAEWLERYSDTGIVPVLIMLASTAVAALVFWARVAPTADAHSKNVFFTVMGTPLLVTALQLMKVMCYPQEGTPEIYTIVTFIEGVAGCVEWILKGPVTYFTCQQASDFLQALLFAFGIYWFNVTKLFEASGRSDVGDVKFCKINFILLVIVAIFVMPVAIWVGKITCVFVKCIGIYQFCCWFKDVNNWLRSTERTSKKKKDSLTIAKSTDPDVLWNKIVNNPGMEKEKYELITDGCRNKTARQDALLPYLQKYFTVTDDRIK